MIVTLTTKENKKTATSATRTECGKRETTMEEDTNFFTSLSLPDSSLSYFCTIIHAFHMLSS